MNRTVLLFVGQPRGVTHPLWLKEYKRASELLTGSVDVVCVTAEDDRPEGRLFGYGNKLWNPNNLHGGEHKLKAPLNKPAWEEYMREQFAWTNSVHFAYASGEPTDAVSYGMRQFVYVEDAVRKLPRFWQSHADSTVIKLRYDAVSHKNSEPGMGLYAWQRSTASFLNAMKTYDHSKDNDAPNMIFDVWQMHAGLPWCSDYVWGQDGKAIQVQGKLIREWIESHNPPLRKNNVHPESYMPMFAAEHNFNIAHKLQFDNWDKNQFKGMVPLASFVEEMDDWRKWYQ